MNKIAGFEEWMHTIKLKLYGWMTKTNIQAGDNTRLEKLLNDYTGLRSDMQSHLNTLGALNESKRLTMDIAKNLGAEGIPVPAPKTDKIDKQITQLDEAMDKVNEILNFINSEIRKRGLKVNRMAEGRLYLVQGEISSRG